MTERRDPVERASRGALDLYDVSTWERRTRFDWLSAVTYRGLVVSARVLVVLLALIILVAQFALIGLSMVHNPLIGALSVLSVIPAFGLTGYIWYSDVTTREPLHLLVGTFLLGILFAGFAAVFEGVVHPVFALVPIGGSVLFFYLVVGPVEETVKWLAVRLYPFGSDHFDAVIDGAVYGAVAGLGFATIENSLYITRQYLHATQAGSAVLGVTVGTAALRTFAGPGHVIYSAYAGYYLGLAKFNRENAGPIVVKGLLIAVLLHGTYDTLVGFLPAVSNLGPLSQVPSYVVFIGFVLVYDGLFGYVLYRKIARYRRAYHNARTATTISFPDATAEADGDDQSTDGHEAAGDPNEVTTEPNEAGDATDQPTTEPNEATTTAAANDAPTEEGEPAGGETAEPQSGGDRPAADE